MKLCPQCEFIYEDDQTLCDMDGGELVYDPGLPASEETVLSNSAEIHDTLEIPATVPLALPVSQPAGWHFRRKAVAALAAIVLVALLFVVFYARTHQPRSFNANEAGNQTPVQSSNRSTELATSALEPASELISVPTDASSTEQPSDSQDVTTASSAGSLGRGRMLSNPVSAGGSGNRTPVVVVLNSGSSIQADEAWEKREGIWYRQGGMVTFLKRSQVKGIQRGAVASPSLKPAAPNSPTILQPVEKNFKPENTIAQNQSRSAAANSAEGQSRKLENATAQNRPIAKPEVASTKKESKMTSFLKKTGRILKRPFQF